MANSSSPVAVAAHLSGIFGAPPVEVPYTNGRNKDKSKGGKGYSKGGGSRGSSDRGAGKGNPNQGRAKKATDPGRVMLVQNNKAPRVVCRQFVVLRV
ncbi:hypothetical protein CDL15_Pgr001512 [Punica granatum]|uniref:Uncharacterized protein n=1 Tax=Punica granatum TaxID=22663 RepID=A0A218X558_PUNGR|nr:hypothetical protein CDL15_Pgr001512 [Punica granatum]PKI58341.1 hypothetical protein CRG98_021279 [Punica granatum]